MARLDPLRARAELLATEPGDLRLQLLDRQLRDNKPVLGCGPFDVLCDQPCFELGNIVGQLIGREQHAT
jgi:hypothetical protein